MNSFRSGCCFTIVTMVLTSTPVFSQNPLNELSPGEWYQVPNSHLRQVEKKPNEYSDYDAQAGTSQSFNSYQRNAGLKAIINNWSGGTFDSKRNRLLIFGGGHNGYGGNEVYAFDLDTLKWSRLTDPTPFPVRCRDNNYDGTPVSRHTYGGLSYVAHLDVMFVLGGALDCATGGAGGHTPWALDFSNNRWRKISFSGTGLSTHAEDKSAYDPLTGQVHYHTDYWYEFDLDSSVAATKPSFKLWATKVSMALDPKRRVIVEIGGGNSWIYDLNLKTRSKMVFPTTGDKRVERAGNPGLVYDPVSDRIVGWAGGAEIYSLDIDAGVWFNHSPAVTNRVTPPPVTTSGGVYGRFAYSPTMNLFVTVNAVDEDVFIYKLNAQDGGAGDSQAPAPPRNLQAL